MEIILLENIKNLGKIGEVVKVKRGYGRNYLLKKGKALNATTENLEIVKKKKDDLNKKNIELKKLAKNKSEQNKKKKYTFTKRTLENGELYGTIKPREISKKIHESDKIEIQPSLIELHNEINKVGTFNAIINLHPEIQAKILIEVVKQED